MTFISQLRAHRSELLIAILFIVLATIMTWPLAANLSRAVSDPGDPYLNTFLLDWAHRQMTGEDGSVFDAPFFHPSRNSLALSENLFGIAFVLVPIRLVGVDALTAHNLAILLGFAFSGFAMYLLGRHVSGSRYAAVLAGIAFTFAPYRFTQLSHLQNVWAVWLPISLLTLLRASQKPTPRGFAVFGFSLLLLSLSNLHFMLLGGLALAVTILLIGGTKPAREATRFICTGLVTQLLVAILLLPVLLPYRELSSTKSFRGSYRETTHFSALPSDWLIGGPPTKIYSEDATRFRDPELWLFPGFCLALTLPWLAFTDRRRVGLENEDVGVLESTSHRKTWIVRALDIGMLATGLLILGIGVFGEVRFSAGSRLSVEQLSVCAALFVLLLIARSCFRLPRFFRRSSLVESLRAHTSHQAILALLLWAVLGFIGSLGLNFFFHDALFEMFGPFRGIRVPARWAMIAYVGLAGLFAIAAARLHSITSGGRRFAAMTVLAAFLLFELRAAPIRWYMADTAMSPAYDWIATLPSDISLLELPMNMDTSEYEYALAATRHRHPIANGVSGSELPDHAALAAMSTSEQIGEEFFELLRSLNINLLVIHADRLPHPEAVISIVRKGLEHQKLRFIEHFDHELRGDYVFEVIGSRATTLPARNTTRFAHLQSFLNGNGFTESQGVTGFLTHPSPRDRVRGALRVEGWALSPHGVKSVNVLLNNGRVRHRATLTPRPDLAKPFAWSSKHLDRAGYAVDVAKRPDDVWKDADIQIEIIDGQDRRLLLPHLWFTWDEAATIRAVHRENVSAILAACNYQAPEAVDEFSRGEITIEDLHHFHLRDTQLATDEEFLHKTYERFLGRGPDESALPHHGEKLARGVTRRKVLSSITSSSEFLSRIYR